MAILWTILLRGAWVLLLLFSGLMTLLMFAFADSPDAGKAASRMIGPIFVITLIDFAASGWLLMHGAWWSMAAAYVTLLLPPVLVFLGYRVLMK
jgi:hypothetical protein